MEDHQVSLKRESPRNVILLPSVLWHCWLGDRKDIRPVKSWVMVCWWWRFDWSFARLIATAVTTISIIFAPITSRMKTFSFRLTRVFLVMAVKGGRCCPLAIYPTRKFHWNIPGSVARTTVEAYTRITLTTVAPSCHPSPLISRICPSIKFYHRTHHPISVTW